MLWGLMWWLGVTPRAELGFAIFGTMGMYFPGVAAMLVRTLVSRDASGSGLFVVGRRGYYAWAWLLFPMLIALTLVVSLLSGWAQPDTAFSQLRDLFVRANSPVPASLTRFAWGQLLTALALGVPVHAITTIGEELGWRDFLLPRLIRIGFKEWTALVMTGIVWGLWHIPVISMNLEYVGHPYLGIPMFVVYTVLVGVVLGWLQLASGSVWVPAIAHGSINAVQRAELVFVTGYNPLIAGPLGSLCGWIPLAAFIGWLAWTRRVPVGSVAASLASRAESRAQVPVSGW